MTKYRRLTVPGQLPDNRLREGRAAAGGDQVLSARRSGAEPTKCLRSQEFQSQHRTSLPWAASTCGQPGETGEMTCAFAHHYTWSHCISDIFESQTSASASPSQPGNREIYRSNCNGADLRQLFNLNFVATSPRFSNRLLRILASNWQVSPIMQLKSAQFFTVTSGTDVAL